MKPTASEAHSHICCDALILDDHSRSDTIPDIKVQSTDAVVAHEASAGKMNEEHLFYLQSRGMSEEEARSMIVNGFLSPIVRELPLEYAAEMNVLIGLEMENSVA